MKCICVLTCLAAVILHSPVYGLENFEENDTEKGTLSNVLKDGQRIPQSSKISAYDAVKELHANNENAYIKFGRNPENLRRARDAAKADVTIKPENTQLNTSNSEQKEKIKLEVKTTNTSENKDVNEKKELTVNATTSKPTNSSYEDYNSIMSQDFDILLESRRYATFLSSPLIGDTLLKVYGPDSDEPQPLVSTAEGIVRGRRINKHGQTYHSFEGIPYAAKPERFKAPKPPIPWTGVKDTTREMDLCAQYNTLIGGFYGKEDCLYLNVHTPSVNSTGLPVMVIIHGGGFNLLTGTRFFFGPERFIEKNIIVILVNYRLGALGFLSTRTADAPGNAGMKDIIAALTWIKKNIHMFGGDPSKVTLFGSSSGATAVEYLTLSKMTKGLFSQFIIQSGSALNYLFFDSDPIKYALRLGGYLDFHTNDVKKLVEYLKGVGVEELAEASQKLGVDVLPLGVSRPFSPCVEDPVPGEEMFLHDIPENILRSGDFIKVPSMIGFTTMEGSEFVRGILADPEFLNTLDNTFPYLLPPDLVNAMDRPQKLKALVDKVRQFYFHGEQISNATAKNYVDLIGDTLLLYGLFESINIRTQQSDGPIYFWQMAYDGFLGLFRKIATIGVPGVPHADELGYMFRVALFDGYPTTNETEEVAQRLVALVSNFMKYGMDPAMESETSGITFHSTVSTQKNIFSSSNREGLRFYLKNPTPVQTTLLPVKWIPLEANKPINYLEVTEKMAMKQDPHPYVERMAFWKQLYANKHNLV